MQGTVAPGKDIFSQSFAIMFVGLGISCASSLLVSANSSLASWLMNNPFVTLFLVIIELILVFILSSSIMRMSYGSAIFAFVFYAALNGITLSSVLMLYQIRSVAIAFFSAALVFGIMAVYGSTTRRDLSSFGSIGFMALIGVIIASLINLLVKSDVVGYVVSYIAVGIFIILTAYDTQKLKEIATTSDSPNLGIYGALTLYLDFVNIFLNLLNIFGRRRRD